MNLLQLSKDVLLCSKHGSCTGNFHKHLGKLSTDELVSELKSDHEKVVFWCNVYNALIIQELAKDTAQSSDLFTRKVLLLSDLSLSFDDIEHGILRRSKTKWSLGYLNRRKIEEWELRLRVDKMDPRIHFALNCGANSCPPITVYALDTLDQQLDENAKLYLTDSSIIEIDTSAIKVPRIFLWYFADFGGYEGIKKYYKKYKLVPFDTKPKVSFLAYDWSVNIDNFTL